MTRPTRDTRTFITTLKALKPAGAATPGMGCEAEDPIYVSLTKEVVVRHNGKTNRSTRKVTTSNVL
jgi:hypothetical protein